jgi:iron complex outermembrane receptor protein
VLDRDLHKGTYGAVTVPQSYVLPIAHAAVTQSPAPWLTLRTNLGRYARLPTITERYGNTGFILGNPDLTHESGINADAGVTLRRGGAGGDGAADSAVASSAPRITIDGAVFVAHARDLIHFQQTNQGVMRARNVGRARTVGAELATDARWRRFRMTAQATFANARDVGDVSSSRGRLLPHQPRVRVYARPELRGVPLAGSWRAGVHADVDVTGGNHLDPANQIAVARRVVFGAGARIDSTRYGLDLVVSAQNLSNSHINDLAQFPLPGRAVFATLRWSSPALLSPEPTHNETGLTGAQETHP